MPAGELLGDDHPLARAGRELRRTTIQLAATAAFVAVAALHALVAGQSPKALVIAALVVGPVLAIKVALAADDRRTRARDAIVAGLEDVPALELRGARRHFASRRCRHDLASALWRLVEYEGLLRAPAETEADDVVMLLGTVTDDLEHLASSRLRGVAACEQLVADGVLARLAEADRDALRRELRRLHFLLVAR